MKAKTMFGVLTSIMLLTVFCLPVFNASTANRSKRYHQHLQEPGYTPCEDGGTEEFCTHLPIVMIDTGGKSIPGAMTGVVDRFGEAVYQKAADGSDYINVSVSVIDNESGNNHISDAPALTTRSLFRIRGHASRRFEKSPYLLKFVNEDGTDNDLAVMGMDKHHEWALHGPYLDKSLVRNYLCYNIAGEIMEYAPNVRYCELFLDGEYRGLYLMVETIANGGPEGGRLDLSDTFKGTQVSGYLLRIDRPTEVDLETERDIYAFTERTNEIFEDVAIRYPGKSRLTAEFAHEIEMDFSRFEKALYSYDYDTEDYGYQNWIDVDSFVNYYIINEFTHNVDAGIYSTYLYKEPNGKYKMCVWDFNNTFDNYVDDRFDETRLYTHEKPFFNMLTREAGFAEKVIERYYELRRSYFSDEYMYQYIDDTLKWLGPAVERNSERWAAAYTDYDPLHPRERNVHSLDEAVEQLKDWIHARGAWLDDNIGALRAVAHPSRNKQYNQ